MAIKVKLTYFKRSGKYYTEGEYESEHKWLHDITDEIHKMRSEGKLPGINGAGEDFIIHVDMGDTETAVPALIV
ncbi:hypothetical protein [Yersinia phage vB_Yru_GN1]|uniref:Uncharacterized protein n=1 Tax=Yersinia phage vB_Yru_GN1 TaxID=3074381 RepID=A0AA86MDD7_9CAUD|nr:hypothetical protein [Yersinia phage vB_Yru_GN1]